MRALEWRRVARAAFAEISVGSARLDLAANESGSWSVVATWGAFASSGKLAPGGTDEERLAAAQRAAEQEAERLLVALARAATEALGESAETCEGDMTTRHAGYLVTLERDIREDDAQTLIDAIGMLRGVIRVAPVEGGCDQQIADDRARRDLGQRLLDVVYPERKR